MKKIELHHIAITALLLTSLTAQADIQIKISSISTDSSTNKNIGTINVVDTSSGLLLTPNLADLPPGNHGFHVHQYPSCEPLEKDGRLVAGLAAGGHYDPENTGKHEGFAGNGHKGDMPVLVVDADGTAKTAVTVPHLKERDIYNKSVVIHAGGDNYSDEPLPLGGGGARIACGVIGQSANTSDNENTNAIEGEDMITLLRNIANSL